MKLRMKTALTVVAVAAAYGLPAGAVSPLPFSQTPGFYAGASGGSFAAATQTTGGTGGLDFFDKNNLVIPPTIQIFKGGPATNGSSMYQQIGWGCDATGGGGGCANANTVGNGFVGTSLFGNPARSALKVTGLAGNLDANWNDVTVVEHQNTTIDGGSNVMTSVEVHSFLEMNGYLVDNPRPDPSVTTVEFTETPNTAHASCTLGPDIAGDPHPGAPVDPLNSGCDDFALVGGLDLSPIPQLPPQIATNTGVRFQIVPFNSSTTLVCPGVNVPGGDPTTQDSRCRNPVNTGTWYAGTDIIIYTAEGNPVPNKFTIQAQLFDTTIPPVVPIPLFVIGDCEYDQAKLKKGAPLPADNGLRELGDVVNFWGAQWWKNNCMSKFVSNGYESFKGYATNAVVNKTGSPNCGIWQARPGNSGHPPDTLPDKIALIVTDNVVKQGPNIGGNIKQIVIIDRKNPNVGDNYAGNPGHAGWGTITDIPCTAVAP